MNLILLVHEDFIGQQRVRLTGRRFEHIHAILKAKIGDQLTVGLINGNIGQGKVRDFSHDAVELEVVLTYQPPAPLPLTLIMPMVRPPMFKRILFHATTLGVKRIYVLNFARVEKSFWTSSSLHPEEMQEQLILGLEQAKDTVLPHIEIHDRFKPFVEDMLPALSKDTLKLVAHPGGAVISPITQERSITLIIGPEGGLVDFEHKLLVHIGFQLISLGDRILRVDTAVMVAIAKFCS